MRQLNLDYLAGFFDGEGNISMCVDVKNDMMRCRLSLYNTNKEVVDTLKAQYGGFIHTNMNRRPNGELKHYRKDHWKTSYTLIIQLSKKHKDFIRELAERCIVKKPKLLLALEYLETLGDRGAVKDKQKNSEAKEKRKRMISLMNNNRNRAGATTERVDGVIADATV